MILLVVLALILSEVFLSVNETVGFILYSVLIASCLLSLSHVQSLREDGKLVIVFMIIPIVRITELFIPFEFFWKVLISYVVLLFLSFYYSVRFELDHGHKKEKLGLLPIAIVLGAALGLLGNYFFSFDKYSWLIYLLPLIAYSEEILFRGMIQNLLEKNYRISSSILITALLYGVFSLGYGILFSAFMLFAGIIIGLIYSHTKNIILAAIINFIVHYFLFVSLQTSF